eukprot:CAMPEP_0118659582 /NCGR_PEP_ID=MMETSP0785-20121206/15191_1 /TAXON_ID=91992 /ORGANISM="Bolidomonas pacifica, Strain CCMP 1866" /LENGTH=105 /DNA_ID=CAMNT_0006552701 /DNA_START=464 /DNA_END=777 /DNA_ORIENTATION=+
MNEAGGGIGGEKQQLEQQQQQQQQQQQPQNWNQPLSPIDESNQHGGRIAGVGSEHGDRLRNTSPQRQYHNTQPMQQQQQQQQQHPQQMQQAARTGGAVPWAQMAP